MADTWGSDVRISLPVPPKEDIEIPMGGFGFTINGLRPNISDSDIEEMMTPTYSPWRDGEVDGQ